MPPIVNSVVSAFVLFSIRVGRVEMHDAACGDKPCNSPLGPPEFGCDRFLPDPVMVPHRSGHLSNSVFAAKRIRHVQIALWIVLPLPIHQEAVWMPSRRQFNSRLPRAVCLPLHADGGLLPLREITDQLDGLGGRCYAGEKLRLAALTQCARAVCCLVLLCHVLFFVGDMVENPPIESRLRFQFLGPESNLSTGELPGRRLEGPRQRQYQWTRRRGSES